jgi:hypothetical protein
LAVHPDAFGLFKDEGLEVLEQDPLLSRNHSIAEG